MTSLLAAAELLTVRLRILQRLQMQRRERKETHISYLMGNEVPTDYQPQMLWQMACTGAQWRDFVSFDPRLPEKYQLFVKRFFRDEARIAAIEAEVRQFLLDVAKSIADLEGWAA